MDYSLFILDNTLMNNSNISLNYNNYHREITLNSKEKDKDYDFEKEEVVKRYFSKIYSVLDESVRGKLLQLNIPAQELKKIVKHIGFLPKKKQLIYLEDFFEQDIKKQEKSQ